MGMTSECGQGSHTPACPGYGTEHYFHPEEDNGEVFPCECGCHHVPAHLGYTAIPNIDAQPSWAPPEAITEPSVIAQVPVQVPVQVPALEPVGADAGQEDG
jgi:hypothetical protein